jgi:hypothetical protein
MSLDLPLVAALSIIESERRANCTQLDQQGEPEQLKLSKTDLSK